MANILRMPDCEKKPSSYENLRALACEKIEEKLLQRLHVFRNSLGVVSCNSADGFLVRSFLGIVALAEQIGDLIDAQRGALQCRTDLALPFGAVASGALRLVGGRSVCREGR